MIVSELTISPQMHFFCYVEQSFARKIIPYIKNAISHSPVYVFRPLTVAMFSDVVEVNQSVFTITDYYIAFCKVTRAETTFVKLPEGGKNLDPSK